LANFVLVEQLCVRFTFDDTIYTAQLIQKDHDVPLRIDKAHKNSIFFQKVGVSE